jgi:hypothetical protein
MLLLATLSIACSSSAMSCGRRSIATEKLEGADRIDVIVHNEKISTISEPQKIRDTLAFIRKYRDGWVEPLAGPTGALLRFSFFENDRFLGEFGLGWNYIASGGLSRSAPESEINDLAHRLNLQWPPPR